MRYGIVRNIDRHLGEGTIEDINQQEISFSLAGKGEILSIGQQVCFEIALEKQGLRAVRITQSTEWTPIHAGCAN
ncbi:hypothetical protein [Pedobacter sp.]|uniref:hypothetical protein n=1 Tax=Pedobacter sp. TaxID=1411316 RepID=UPI003BAC232C